MSISIGHVDGNFFTRYLKRTMADILPRRFKRLLYVGSVMGLILRQRTVDQALLERINSVLRLARDATVILFPMYLYATIWRHVEVSTIPLQNGVVSLAELKVCELCDADCWRTALFLARQSADWLHYGSDQLMATDVHDMLLQLPKAA